MHFGRTSLVRKLAPKKILLLDQYGIIILDYNTTISKIPFISKLFKFPFFSKCKRSAYQFKEAYMYSKLLKKNELSIYLYYDYARLFCESFSETKININEYINRLKFILKNNIDYLEFNMNITENSLYRTLPSRNCTVFLRVYFDLNEVKHALEYLNKNV